MFILGLDIGYSNLKVAMGDKGSKLVTKSLPAGAGLASLMPGRLPGPGSAEPDFIKVQLNGEAWAAGVEPDRLQGWERELHEDYPSTSSYMALFYAALLLTEREVVDVVVTGLPVEQFKNESLRNALIGRLTGKHQIAPKRSIEVLDVIVVPQPAGAYMDVVSGELDDDILSAIQYGKTVVIDPGFFSVDWVALVEGEIRYQSSGTSLKAMSVLIQEVSNLIGTDYAAPAKVDQIEKCIRSGRSHVYLFGSQVELKPYIDAAAKNVSKEALVSMRKTMREDGMDADVVLLAGGGAENYEESARELFPKSRIVVSDNPVLSNARGFWFCG